MSKYKPIRKVYVYISKKNFDGLFFGKRTLYKKDGKFYVRYKNKYYRALYDGHSTYDVIIRW